MRARVTGVLLVAGEQSFVEVAGLPLWKRLILNGRKAGIHAWVILARSHADMLRRMLTSSPRAADLTCQIYDMTASMPPVLAALPAEEDLLVLSCSAVFESRLLLDLQDTPTTTLGVAPGAAASMVDVAVHHGRVARPSAEASGRYHSAGLMHCSGAVLGKVIRQTWERVRRTTTPFDAFLPALFDSPPVHAFDVSQYLWVPLHTPLAASVQAAETRLLQSLGRRGDSFVVRHLNRRLSRLLTRRLVRTAITPNQITLFSACLGISGALLLAQPAYPAQVLGSLLFLLSTIIDGCDGEVARLTFQESEFGGKLDIMLDNVVHLLLFSGIAIGLYRETGRSLMLLLGGLSLGGMLFSLLAYLPSRWRRTDRPGAGARLHESLASRDFAYILFLLAGFGRLDWFLWATAVGTYLFAASWFIRSYLQRQRQHC